MRERPWEAMSTGGLGNRGATLPLDAAESLCGARVLRHLLKAWKKGPELETCRLASRNGSRPPSNEQAGWAHACAGLESWLPERARLKAGGSHTN